MSPPGGASGTVGLDAVAQLPRPHPLLVTPRRVLKLRSDAALAERFRAGDQEAYAVLYERHRASVIAVCIGVLGSRHDAEDAAQDTFAALAVALRSTPPRDLRAWLTRVARNAAIDVIRRRRAVSAADENVERHAPASTEVRAELELVLAGLRELPESQRTALLMRELGGHSYQEIGDLLELDESAVRGLIARGRIGLRAHREATELPCAAVREALAAEPDGRHRDRTVRRHLRNCASCKAYGQGLRRDARSLRGFVPAPLGGGVAGGGAIFGGFAVKTAITGGVLSQVTAACAVSVCAVGGFALLYPHAAVHHDGDRHATGAAARAAARAHAAGASANERAAAAAAGAAARAHAATTRSPGAAATPTLAPERATKVISSASLVLIHRFHLPGSTHKRVPDGAPAAAGASPTSPPLVPTHPAAPWGGSAPTGGSDDPAAPSGSGSSGADGGSGGAAGGSGSGSGATGGSGGGSGGVTGPGTVSGSGSGSEMGGTDGGSAVGTGSASPTGTYPYAPSGGWDSHGTTTPSGDGSAPPSDGTSSGLF